MIRHPGRHRNRINGVNKTTLRRQTVDTVGAPLRFQFLFSDVGHPKHFLAGLAAQSRLTNETGGDFPDQAGSEIAPTQWRGDENYPSNFRPMTKEQFLSKILADVRRKRHLVRRSPKNFHPKLIAAIGQEQPTDAAAHAVSDDDHRLHSREAFLHRVELLAKNRRGIGIGIAARVTIKPELVMLPDNRITA